MQKYLNKNIPGRIGLILTSWLLLTGCGGSKPRIPDVSHIPINVTIHRFDKDFFRIDTNNGLQGIKLLDNTYPNFVPTYIQQIMNFGPLSDTNRLLQPQLVSFLTNKDFRALQDSVEVHFKDVRPLEKELTRTFRLTKYYLPYFKAPRVITFMSAIGNYGAVTIDSIVGIGLDMYMGAEFPVYRLLPDYPDYIIKKFTPAYITVNVMKVLSQHYFPQHKDGSKLVEYFMDLGVQQYFLEKVLPETPEYIRLGYTKEQLDFCNESEEMIWQYFVQNKLLFTTDWQEVTRYVGEGPSTQGLPKEVPGQIGAFVGYRIVQQFMKKHPDMTLEKLVNTQNVLGIFNETKYRP